MPIQSTDLVFLASQNMTQHPDGGGFPSENQVLDNEENGIFPDIASGDLILGRVWLNKVYAAVRSQDTDVFMSARVFLTKPPTDPDVDVLMFSTGSWWDTRKDAIEYLYEKLTPGVVVPLRLAESINAGATVISGYIYNEASGLIPTQELLKFGIYTKSTNSYNGTSTDWDYDSLARYIVLSYEPNGVLSHQEIVRPISYRIGAYNDEKKYHPISIELMTAVKYSYDAGSPYQGETYIPPTKVRRVATAEPPSVPFGDPTAEYPIVTFNDMKGIKRVYEAIPAMQNYVKISNISVRIAKIGMPWLQNNIRKLEYVTSYGDTYDKYPEDFCELIGIDLNRLEAEGKCKLFQKYEVVCLHHTDEMILENPVQMGIVYNLGREYLARVYVNDKNGKRLQGGTGGVYTADLRYGTVTFFIDADLTPYEQPFTVYNMIVHESAIGKTEEVLNELDQIDYYKISLLKAPKRDFPATSYLSSTIMLGDMQSYATTPFTQQTWDGVWTDYKVGNGTAGKFNHLMYPITITNKDTVTERWMIKFKSTTAGTLIGETLGVFYDLDLNQHDYYLMPDNPVTGGHYFRMNRDGFSTGWVSGNILRFNTVAATYPIWVMRAVLSGEEVMETDSFGIEFLGDIDAPLPI